MSQRDWKGRVGFNPLTEQDELELADLAGGGTGTSPTATGSPERGIEQIGSKREDGRCGCKVGQHSACQGQAPYAEV